MPVYEFKCLHCKSKFDRFLPLANYQQPQFCKCGNRAQKLISAPAVQGDFQPYECPVTGKFIEGRRAHEENLKKTGCRVLEAGETQATTARREKSEAELENKIADSAAEFVANLDTASREQLGREVEHGDIALTRQ
jgi:putative FmdB family regulatory protein